MSPMDRISIDPGTMGGKACIAGTRVTVSVIVEMLAAGTSQDQILEHYPYLKLADIQAALKYAAWRVEEREISIQDQAS